MDETRSDREARMTNIAVIGYGAIAGYVFQALGARAEFADVTLAGVVARPGRAQVAAEKAGPDVQIVGHVSELRARPDLVLDCAGHAGLRAHGVDVLAAGIDLISVSVGALADDDLHQALSQAAERGGARLRLIPGAIGGLDVLAAARQGGLDEVTYTGRKPPLAWRDSPAEAVLDLESLDAPAVHFAGTAGDAARAYPKNANVAAAVALAGAGFEGTRVELIADPTISTNRHEVTASGTFGRFHIEIDGNALPDNPKSSALTAMSMLRALADHQAGIKIG